VQAAASGAPLPAPAPAPTVAAAPAPGPAAADDPFDRAEADALTPPGQETLTDPAEELNRAILSFNDGVDTVLFRPIAWIYHTVVPDPAIYAIRRAFANLRSPVLLANDLLQADLDDAAVTGGRFLVNSTVGLLGLFDVAEDIGLPAHHADFGQTLHSYGVGPGAYVMLPLLGPSTVRDAVGRGVDVLLDPLTWLLPTPESYYLTGTEVVVKREELLEPLDQLKEGSIDWYGALRSAYYQSRAVELRKGRAALQTGTTGADALFDATE
jgi:phospholipid-binding lipoprotein MlaA